MEKTDEQLIADFLKGNRKSLDFLVQKYFKSVFAFSYRFVADVSVAEDMTQEVFVKAWKNLKKFHLNKNFKVWLFQITKNTCLDYLKKKKAIPFSQFDDENGENFLLNTIADDSPQPDELLKNFGDDKKLQSALEILPAKSRLILFLKYNEDLNFREIAESLKESINTVKSRHFRALAELKKIMQENEPNLDY